MKIVFCVVFMPLLIFCGCKNDEPIEILKCSESIEIQTMEVSNITNNSATVEGTLLPNDVCVIAEAGVVYSTQNNPEISDNKITIESDSDIFTVILNDLEPERTYYVRFYAEHQEGVSYGNILSFSTNYKNTLLDERDGQSYKVVKIGNQYWMAENLKYLPYVNLREDVSADEARYYIYNNNDTALSIAISHENYTEYGVLYNHTAALTACPPGWRLPSDEDWGILELELGIDEHELEQNAWRGTNQGSRLAGHADLWVQGNLVTNPYFGETGFNAKPAGFMHYHYFDANNYQYLSTNAIFWTSTNLSGLTYYVRNILSYQTKIERTYARARSGLSIRCVKE
jgi:uncharacterized protein (TIGR02145 family)